MVERICSNRVRQQVYASAKGDFTMQLGGMTDSYLDASGDSTHRDDEPSSTQRRCAGASRHRSTQRSERVERAPLRLAARDSSAPRHSAFGPKPRRQSPWLT